MITILLPAYNEEKDLPVLLGRIQSDLAGLDYHVLVVNDGSRDGTLSVANAWAGRLPLIVLDHGTNKGLGQAMLTGLQYAAQSAAEGDIVAAMDADNTHNPDLIRQMVQMNLSGKDVVIASRYTPGGEEIGLNPIRKVLSRGASFLLRLFFPIEGARDYTCGYRTYTAQILRQAFTAYGMDGLIEEHGFTCMAELLIKLSLIGARVGEAPLVLRYDLKSGKSKMKFIRTIWRYGVLIKTLKQRQSLPVKDQA
jgi:dolichol-phosphate mannosyltransferase